jgi:hypothetical protein
VEEEETEQDLEMEAEQEEEEEQEIDQVYQPWIFFLYEVCWETNKEGNIT